MNKLKKRGLPHVDPHDDDVDAPSFCRHCSISCCNFSIWADEAPPLCKRDLGRIIDFTGTNDFYHRTGPPFTMKCRKNGFCHFFDEPKGLCRIYGARPFDCRVFPFDFYTISREEGWWLIWDCPYSQRLDRGRIEAILTRFEKEYAEEITEFWDYGNEQFARAMIEAWNMDCPHAPRPFRFLRKVDLSPP